MIDIESTVVATLILIAGAILGFSLALSYTIPETLITSGKVFKIKDATYKCNQIQKLEYNKGEL